MELNAMAPYSSAQEPASRPPLSLAAGGSAAIPLCRPLTREFLRLSVKGTSDRCAS